MDENYRKQVQQSNAFRQVREFENGLFYSERCWLQYASTAPFEDYLDFEYLFDPDSADHSLYDAAIPTKGFLK